MVLPPKVDQALKEFAKKHDEVEYKPSRGMVKFKSDLTFEVGKAVVKPKAKKSLRKLAQLAQSEASKYQLRIVGHTDSLPIERPETKKKHPTNWHLAAHRAIAVEQVLEEGGVAPWRMTVKGYGKYRPVTENDPQTGAKKNRRVEIFLTEMRPVDKSLLDSIKAAGSQ